MASQWLANSSIDEQSGDKKSRSSREHSPSPAPARPATAAHVIRDDREAIDVAHRLADDFAREASVRDRERRLPLSELDRFSQSGLWGINVPRAYGGAEVSYVTLTEVIKIISAADPSIGQIPQNHFAVLDMIRLSGNEEQKRFFFAEALHGVRLGNAFAESGSKNAGEFRTRIAQTGNGFVVNGRKFYCSGALLAHLVPVAATSRASYKSQLSSAMRPA